MMNGESEVLKGEDRTEKATGVEATVVHDSTESQDVLMSLVNFGAFLREPGGLEEHQPVDNQEQDYRLHGPFRLWKEYPRPNPEQDE